MTWQRDFRRFVFALAAAIVVLLWAGLALALLAEAQRGAIIALALAAGVGTEGLFWLGAFMLGWSVFERRRGLWRRLTGRTTPAKETLS